MSKYRLQNKNEQLIVTGAPTGDQIINILNFTSTEQAAGSATTQISWNNVPSNVSDQYKTGDTYEISIVKVETTEVNE